MRALGIVLSMVVAVNLIGAGSAQEKKATNKEKIVAVWEFIKCDPKTPVIQAGDTIEFTKDGNLERNYKIEGKQHGGTYEVDADTIKVKGPSAKEPHTYKIKTLTEKELVFEWKVEDTPFTFTFKKK